MLTSFFEIFAGRNFAVCSTEGVAIFSLDHQSLFNPFELSTDVTPEQVKNALANDDYSEALKSALRLNEKALIEKVLLGTPVAQSIVQICYSVSDSCEQAFNLVLMSLFLSY